jgi:L-ascorbate metabolism protein UlaG (beta-lactamase superfamily)
VPELPDVDVVLISHTHYDHLDSDTINALAARTPPPLFCVPLGTKSIMEGMLMGVDSHLVMEFDWSEEATLPDTTGKGM